MKTVSVYIILACIGLLSNCGGKPSGSLPTFSILLSDSTTVLSSDKLPEGKVIVASYFSPDCSHCQDEIKDILKNISKLKDVQFLYVTPDELSQMKVFIKYFGLKDQPNFIVGKDIDYSFMRATKPEGIPYSFLYDKDRKLRVVFPTGADGKQLIESINKL